MKKTYFILLFIVLCLVFSFSEEKIINPDSKKISLDVDTAVSLALANNLGLKSERLKFESAKWSMITSWNTFLPDVSISAKLTRSNLNKDERTTTIPISYVPPVMEEKETPLWGLQANFNLSLNLNAYMVFNVYQTVLDWQSGKINLETAKQKLIVEVKKGVYNFTLMEKNIEILNEGIDNAKKRYDKSIINYNNGLISEYDKLSAQVAYENLKPQLIDVQNNYNKLLLNFKNLIGLRKEVEVSFNVEIESVKNEFDKDELISKYISNNLELKSLDQYLKSMQNVRNLAISALTPSFGFGYIVDPTFQKDPLEDDWFGDKKYMDENWKQRGGMFYLSLSLPISSLAPFSKQHMDIIRSQFSIAEARNNLENSKKSFEVNIESILMGLDKSIKSIEILKLNIALAERAFKKAEEAYAAGKKELLEVQNSELELKKAKLNLLQEEYNYTVGLLDLEYAINDKL